ncbi:lipoprotein N-acyltransferase Lnb domain-containing protein [Enhygromyxa salina]|uniref:Lnb N-terminal periplasmic domain-containing protein n=1 Tax=Enhygromyxa salina TaxID=215803 RepID=A0A2S9YUF2_9BACT|nr:DUF4105 domain-containing protein [Enhygromyxa salina]PRQ08735.1 hypothetical protein ENSA7_15530 [Enhygromyxa salina]
MPGVHGLLCDVMFMFAVTAAAVLAAQPAPTIDVYTMGSGDALFHRFGHAAICTIYPDNSSQSKCFNYGTTDFGSPPTELGWSFIRGRSPFWVSVWPVARMIDVYVDDDRSVWRQRIALAPEQARAVATKLEADAARFDGRGPEGSYAYHHFADNCTTRIRDILDDASGGVLSTESDESLGVSFRELGQQGLADITAVSVLAHVFVGRAADREVSEWDAMFLPRALRGSIEARFAASPELIHERLGPPPVTGGTSGVGWLWLFALATLAPTALAFAWRRGLRVALVVTGVMLSIIGAMVWSLSIVSEMPELRYNEALLVFWPTDWLIALANPTRRRTYARVRVGVLLAVAVGLAVGVVHQPLAVVLLIPLAPMLLIAWRPEGRRG